MSDPINLTNADFTFKDKNGNTGSNKGITDLDKTKLNNMVKLLNLLLNTPNSLNFVNTLANINLSNLSASGTGIINSLIDTKLSDKANATDLSNYLPLSGGNVIGNLTVQNKNVVRSVNGVNADEQGNVQLGNLGIITGEIKWFAFNTAPDGYLVCNGAEVNRETYADLFAVIGTTFGEGDGSTTFSIPDLRDRYIIGANTNALGTKIAEQLPNITGDFGTNGDYNASLFADGNIVSCNGAFSALARGSIENMTSGSSIVNSVYKVGFNASSSNNVYTDSGKVYPLSLALLPCIKY